MNRFQIFANCFQLSILGTVVLIEVKICSKAVDLEKEALIALSQIERQNYESEYRDEGFKSFTRYGIAFYKKDAVVRQAV